MPEARAVRVTDALKAASPAVRIHDGINPDYLKWISDETM